VTLFVGYYFSSGHSKVKPYGTFIIPVIMYGSECSCLGKEDNTGGGVELAAENTGKTYPVIFETGYETRLRGRSWDKKLH